MHICIHISLGICSSPGCYTVDTNVLYSIPPYIMHSLLIQGIPHYSGTHDVALSLNQSPNTLQRDGPHRYTHYLYMDNHFIFSCPVISNISQLFLYIIAHLSGDVDTIHATLAHPINRDGGRVVSNPG